MEGVFLCVITPTEPFAGGDGDELGVVAVSGDVPVVFLLEDSGYGRRIRGKNNGRFSLTNQWFIAIF